MSKSIRVGSKHFNRGSARPRLFPNSYAKIEGYSDSFFNISSCVADAAISPVWDGLFGKKDDAGNYVVALPDAESFSIGGKEMLMWSGEFVMCWVFEGQMVIHLNDMSNPVELWRGQTAGFPGDTETFGIYYRISGCSPTPASLTIKTC